MKEGIIIGISGASASGKSLLARTIIEELGSNQVAIISEDSYYKNNPHLSLEEKAHLNYDHPDAFDHTLLCQHLIELSNGQTIQCPTYDYKLHERREETTEISAHKITVLEGILIFNDPRLRKLMDIMIFMDTPLDICLLRRLERDVQERKRTLDSVMTQYESFVRPMYLQFIEPSKHYADLIVPRGGRNRIAIDMIKAKIRELLI